MIKISKKTILYSILILLSPFFFLIAAVFFNWFGSYIGPGEVSKFSPTSQPSKIIEVNQKKQGFEKKQILFGDLHVHTTFSFDAFMLNLPIAQGEGVHPVADACNFARFCSSLDFFAVTDHAEWLTQREWKDSLNSIQNCAAISNEVDQNEVIPFVGWEWTQTSSNPNTHYGHKNIIVKGLEDNKIPPKPIAAVNSGQFANFVNPNPLIISAAVALDFPNRKHYFDWRYKSLVASYLERCDEGLGLFNSSNCMETADSPSALYSKLNDYLSEVMIIPHGTAWGATSPPFASWDNQLNTSDYEPRFGNLVEIYSGHGNSEEYRSWSPLNFNSEDVVSCEQPTQNYLPYCFQAGEIIRERCRIAAGSDDECNKRSLEARENFVKSHPYGILTVPGYDPKEWIDSGQCKDCFLPAFDYRPKMSVQYALASTDFSGDTPLNYKFGFIGSSDNHQGRPGTGYKENLRFLNSESRIDLQNTRGNALLNPRLDEPQLPRSQNLNSYEEPTLSIQSERASSFLYTGGLVAVHSVFKNRDSLWDSMTRREVYATSGDRILLWFDLINHNSETVYPMGAEVGMEKDPVFRVKALGAHFQKPGCMGSSGEVGKQNLITNLCKGECFNPSDIRKNIQRIEIIRIRPQSYQEEPLEGLIEDPWKVFDCEPSQEGCEIEFTDNQFSIGNREVIYYVRAIQSPSLAINADTLGCEMEEGKCIKVSLCGDIEGKGVGDCLNETEERAWSSPIFINFGPIPP